MVRFSNETKAVSFAPERDKERTLSLLMRGDAEYRGHLRRPEEPWPHLLVEQDLSRQPALSQLATLRFRVAYQLLRVHTNAPAPLQPWHCAQFQAVLLVKNLNQSSPGYEDYLWFEIPLYDSRYPVPPEYAAQDTAGSDKFIYSPPGKAFGERRPADGNWVNVDRDVLPLIHDGLQRAWRENFMTASRNLADLHVVAFSVGWELPGPLDVEMRFHALSLEATMRKPSIDEIKKL
jgi:hypothetical protein